MTDQIFFDSDCISSFLWVDKQGLLITLFRKRLCLSQQVYNELGKVHVLKYKVDGLVKSNELEICQIFIGTPEAELYIKLTSQPDPGYKNIGSGEASSIALAKFKDGILGSNNLRDIRDYIELYSLRNITTGEILFEAFNKGLITESQGNGIWQNMLNRLRKLPFDSFSEFLSSRQPID